MNNCKKKSSPGIDGIDYEIIHQFPIKFKLILLDIYNEMHTNSNFPSSWNESYIHLIPTSNGNKVRPISLTLCMCKLYETLIKN